MNYRLGLLWLWTPDIEKSSLLVYIDSTWFVPGPDLERRRMTGCQAVRHRGADFHLRDLINARSVMEEGNGSAPLPGPWTWSALLGVSNWFTSLLVSPIRVRNCTDQVSLLASSTYQRLAEMSASLGRSEGLCGGAGDSLGKLGPVFGAAIG